MERRFDMSDFEQSLKDHADQFRMVPSKRVWNGIYNNLHPGSKWPSITIAILFLFTLVTIGRFNNPSVHLQNPSDSDPGNAKNNVGVQIKSTTEQPVAVAKNDAINFSKTEVNNLNRNSGNDEIKSQSKISGKSSLVSDLSSSSSAEKKKAIRLIEKTQQAGIVISGNSKVEPLSISKNLSGNNSKLPDLTPSLAIGPILEMPGIFSYGNEINSFQPSYISQVEFFTKDIYPITFNENLSFLPIRSLGLFVLSDEGTQILAKRLKSESSLKKLKKLTKKKNKPEWTFYVNPVLSTVSRKSIQPLSSNSPVVGLPNQQSFKLLRNPRPGLEAGAVVGFKIDKKLKFITGFNLSYSGYSNLSNLVHPTYATLTLNDGNGGTYTKNYITHYGNGQSSGHVSLVNYNVEASIPLGIQLNIYGDENIKIDFATSLEPTVLLKNDKYTISADGRYYVNDPELVRRTNLDGHFGTYITFKSKKINWHIGPDFRYQLFSTYKNIYPAKEHLIDYGIRIGISK